MALRVDQESVLSGEICNLTKGETLVRLAFVDGFKVELTLQGNPYRDIAGRSLKFTNSRADASFAHHDALLENDSGVTGDITAARKVKDLLVPVEEAMRLGRAGKEIPHVWVNSLYLEWFTQARGRCVLEASNLEMVTSDAAWHMTKEEEEETQKAASQALVGFMDQIVNLEESREKTQRISDESVVNDDGVMDEFEWEKFMRESEKITDRYGELLEKYGDDREKIDELMGWNSPDDSESSDYEEIFQSVEDETGYELHNFENDFGDEGMMGHGEHPLHKQASAVLDSFGKLNESNNEAFFAVATVCAKLSGALSGARKDGTFDDNGFAIACLKRVLNHINEAAPLVSEQHSNSMPLLLKLRQNIIDLQKDLRG